MRKTVFIWLFITVILNGSFASPPVFLFQQDEDFCENRKRKLRLGLMAAAGILNDNLKEERLYIPFALYPQIFYTLSKPERRSFFDIYLETQFVYVYLDDKLNRERMDAEFGVNLGFQYNLYLSSGVDLFFSLGSGPHFVTVDSPQQAEGFIFSDNFTVGVKNDIVKGWEAALFIRLRHLSNLNFFKPNKGINTAFIGVGFNKSIF